MKKFQANEIYISKGNFKSTLFVSLSTKMLIT